MGPQHITYLHMPPVPLDTLHLSEALRPPLTPDPAMSDLHWDQYVLQVLVCFLVRILWHLLVDAGHRCWKGIPWEGPTSLVMLVRKTHTIILMQLKRTHIIQEGKIPWRDIPMNVIPICKRGCTMTKGKDQREIGGHEH